MAFPVGSYKGNAHCLHARMVPDSKRRACLQIGQVMLTLPHAVALTGLKSAIPLMILYGCIST